MSRTKQDIDRDLAKNDARGFIIGLYEKYPTLDIRDICDVLSERLHSEIAMMRVHYVLDAKDNIDVE